MGRDSLAGSCWLLPCCHGCLEQEGCQTAARPLSFPKTSRPEHSVLRGETAQGSQMPAPAPAGRGPARTASVCTGLFAIASLRELAVALSLGLKRRAVIGANANLRWPRRSGVMGVKQAGCLDPLWYLPGLNFEERGTDSSNGSGDGGESCLIKAWPKSAVEHLKQQPG